MLRILAFLLFTVATTAPAAAQLCPPAPILPQGAASPPPECPLLIRSGLWEAQAASTAKTPFGVYGAAGTGEGLASIEVHSCGDGFDLRGGGEEWTFSREDDESNLYATELSLPNGIYRIEMEATADTLLSGVIKVIGGGFALTRELSYAYRGREARQRSECACRERLKDTIEKWIAEARKWRDLYAMKRHRRAPPGWPEGKRWNANTYDDFLGYVATRKTEKNAVRDFLAKVERGKVDASAPSSGQNSPTTTTAYTDADECQVHLGNAHLTGCFPRLRAEATLAHEAVHANQCCEFERSHRLSTERYEERLTNVDYFADGEVAAYEAEIKFLRDWIPEHCGANSN